MALTQIRASLGMNPCVHEFNTECVSALVHVVFAFVFYSEVLSACSCTLLKPSLDSDLCCVHELANQNQLTNGPNLLSNNHGKSAAERQPNGSESDLKRVRLSTCSTECVCV